MISAPGLRFSIYHRINVRIHARMKWQLASIDAEALRRCGKRNATEMFPVFLLLIAIFSADCSTRRNHMGGERPDELAV